MEVHQKSDGKFFIIHAGREVARDFETENEAWQWADRNIDDQVFDGPNWLAPPLEYRTPQPNVRSQ